jgi:glutathione synthase/RimK-type ligase-like ATP-grasp enzyme
VRRAVRRDVRGARALTAYDVRFVSCAVLPVPDLDTPILVDALAGAGCGVDVADWRDPAVDWSDASVTMLRSPWDYVHHVDEFVAWAERVDGMTSLWNPFPLIRWNTHKAYLLELRERGAPVVPTVVLLRGSAASLDGISDAQGWNAVVVKPAVASGGDGARRGEVGDASLQDHLDQLLTEADVLVQPFVPAVEREGELSVVLFDGRFSHALRKRPAAGEYRVQEHHGGTTELVDANPGVVELAERVAAVLPTPTLYARIDLVSFHDTWHVIEAEVTEPSLWLDLAPPAATERLAHALVARVSPT